MDSDEEDFVFYGTPIEREEELSSRKKKALAESSGHLRSLPAWKQEVRDEEGRRRFHGAFTGGFSAGYYNTAGSKEGWAPQSFTSSRKNRAEVKQQSILNFLDEDEKAELEGCSLATSSKFDTFGFTAAEIARKQAEKEQQHRQSAIPGPAPDEIVLPVTESIGEKLLKKMGWRHGHSIKDSHINTLYDARREARKAFLAFTSDEAPKEPESEPITGDLNNLLDLPTDNDVKSCKSTPVFVLNPKQDLHGLGYDPYKYAPEFRERKRLRSLGGRELGHGKATKDNLFGFKSRDIGPGFGIGALEELDAEDEDVYASGYEFGSFIEEVEEPSRPSLDMQDRPRLTGSENGILPGFKLASKSDFEFQRFDPPVIPKDFEPHHRFSGPLETKRTLYDPPPPEAPPPEDHNIKLLIEGVAALVARCGKLFEDLSKEKNRSNPLYSFLNGGNFHEYYARKLWEEKQKRDQSKLFLEGKPSQDVPKLTADSRGRILGERPLESRAMPSNSAVASADVKFQTNLTDTFTKPAVPNDVLEVSKPFKDDPAKQERYEQFLKEKYHGGLRSYDSGGANNMSEAARARERLDFEAAAAAIEKGYLGQKDSTKPSMDFSSAGVMQFTAGGIEQVKTTQDEEMKLYPKREEFQWRPSPILCKRFDLIDPYMGQPPPAPRIRSKVDTLFFLPDIAKVTKVEESATTNSDALSTLDNQQSKTVDEVASDEKVEVENVERPVDLYKAIFSDDSDDEGENSVVNKEENSDKKVQAANATLNRLIAGDFLESLGKELGLEVPADQPISSNKAGITNEKVIAHASVTALPVHDESSDGKCEVDMGKKSQGSVKSGGVSTSPGDVPPSSEDDKSRKRSRQHHDVKSSSEDEKSRKSSRQRRDVTPSSEDDKRRNSSRRRPDVPPSSEDEKTRKSSRWRNDVTPSFEDEKSRKSSRRHCYSSEFNGDSPGDQHDRYYSRSKERRKESHREERRSRRKHSKHREHRSGDSPERSSRRRSEKYRAEAKREKLS